MGQLIKLQNYVSRYEIDTYRYPSQYIRMKKQQWNRIRLAWENGDLATKEDFAHDRDWDSLLDNKDDNILLKLKSMFQRKQKDSQINNHLVNDAENNDNKVEWQLNHKENNPETMEELMQLFLDRLFHIQMKWASSTIREKSLVDRDYYYNQEIKFFLQRFPDTFLVLYKPIFLVKQAPVEFDIVVITPIHTYCIAILEDEEDSVFIGSNKRFWLKKHAGKENKVLSPTISLNRMEKIVRNIYDTEEIEMPVKKIILNRSGYVDYLDKPIDLDIIEKRNYNDWFNQQRQMVSPLKHVQLKAAKSLLSYCQTSSIKRYEWEDDHTDLMKLT
ncbi:NERD domain-containing protein [Bacillus sp. SM2101]|uniref:NERD domain-containing protein n=1 Tax=Bacillus sp. SM2101 TaxID=2805366 RepID=UPI001BDEAAC2|nr:NERD domain-containing protein [Bacillus sp. SM2101]